MLSTIVDFILSCFPGFPPIAPPVAPCPDFSLIAPPELTWWVLLLRILGAPFGV